MNDYLCRERERVPADPLLPARPVPPFYDEAREAWVLSRYDDVLAALREPRLSLQYSHTHTRSETLAALSVPKLAAWRKEIEDLAAAFAERLPENGPVEIIGEFARPWSLATALIVTGADPADAQRLEVLARQVSEATADSSNASMQAGVRAANCELERYFQHAPIPMSAAAFVALSQTLPCFLANAWLALRRHPAELLCVGNRPELLPKATEELLRYTGLARKASRQVTDQVEIRGIHMTKGQRAILLLASANRDPEQFPDPDRLDITRCAAGHLAFGAGPHSCAGSSVIRMAATVATAAVIRRLAAAEANGPVEWRGGSVFVWASSLHLIFHSNAPA